MRITKPYLAKFARKTDDNTDNPTAPDSSSPSASLSGRLSHGTTFTKVGRETTDDQ